MRALGLLLLPLCAQAQTDLVAGRTWSYSQPGLQTVVAEDSPGGFTTAYRMPTATGTPATPWNAQLSVVIPSALAQGRWLRFRLWARSSTASRIGLVHELNRDPFSKSLDYSTRLTPEWKEYGIVYATSAYAANDSALRLRAGFDAGVIEVAGLRLEDFGAGDPPPQINFDYYGGQSVNEDWRAAAQERIRRYRMGDVRVRVVDANGAPVTGAEVKLEMRRHAFRFGTALADGPLLANTPDGDRYREVVRQWFNYAVTENALKWDFQNGAGFPVADRMLAWCAENNIAVRGHNLLWASYGHLPSGVRALRGLPMRDAIEAHVRDYVERTRGRVVVWDVINEAVTNTEVFADSGRDLLWLPFLWARAVDPDVALAYNDYNITNNRAGVNDGHRAAAARVIRELLANGAPLTTLGIQGHMNLPLTPMAKVIAILDEWAGFGLPLEITEFDVVFGGPRDEEMQARYWEEYLTAAFSHPAVESFVMWGFWDGAHWLSAQGAGLLRRDWSRRPAADVYERLVLREWWSREGGVTGDDGAFAARVFLGDYQATVTVGEQVRQAAARVSANEGVTELTVKVE